MQRTQIYIPTALKREVQQAVRQADESFSDFVRQAIAAQLTLRRLRRKNAIAMFLDILDRAEKEERSMPKDLALHHDQFLYGNRKHR